MTLQEWIDRYEKKTEKWDLITNYSILFRPDKGFFNFKAIGERFEVDHTSTNDIKWAMDKANELAKEYGCKFIQTATSRDPAAYMKLTGAKINIALSHVRANGKMYWCFQKGVI